MTCRKGHTAANIMNTTANDTDGNTSNKNTTYP